MKQIIALFLLTIVLSTCSLCGKSLHLLIMADDEDNRIGIGAKTNIENVKNGFSFLASAMDIPIRIRVLNAEKKKLTSEHLTKWLVRENIDRDDVVVLYYSGHGGRFENSPTIWPYGCFTSERVEFTEFIDNLFEKPAALYLILLDCCNVVPQMQCASAFEIPKFFDYTCINKEVIKTNCLDLFCKSKGLIVASGASPHQVTWYWIDMINKEPPSNGFFTTHFLNSLFKELQKGKANWKDLLRNAKTACELSVQEAIKAGRISDTPRNNSRPQYKVFLRPKRKSPAHLRKYLFERCLIKKKPQMQPQQPQQIQQP